MVDLWVERLEQFETVLDCSDLLLPHIGFFIPHTAHSNKAELTDEVETL